MLVVGTVNLLLSNRLLNNECSVARGVVTVSNSAFEHGPFLFYDAWKLMWKVFCTLQDGLTFNPILVLYPGSENPIRPPPAASG